MAAVAGFSTCGAREGAGAALAGAGALAAWSSASFVERSSLRSFDLKIVGFQVHWRRAERHPQAGGGDRPGLLAGYVLLLDHSLELRRVHPGHPRILRGPDRRVQRRRKPRRGLGDRPGLDPEWHQWAWCAGI